MASRKYVWEDLIERLKEMKIKKPQSKSFHPGEAVWVWVFRDSIPQRASGTVEIKTLTVMYELKVGEFI